PDPLRPRAEQRDLLKAAPTPRFAAVPASSHTGPRGFETVSDQGGTLMDRRAGTRGRIGATLLLATALASLWLVVGAGTAGAATIDVFCPPYGGADLQTAINAAAPGSTLAIHGTCTGNFTVNKNLTLRGVTSGASLNGNAAGTTLTVSTGATVKIQTLEIMN